MQTNFLDFQSQLLYGNIKKFETPIKKGFEKALNSLNIRGHKNSLDLIAGPKLEKVGDHCN